MIRLRDASLLAFTKLRTRRIRTGITVFVSGLLFAGLIGALIVASGTEKSIQSFDKEGLNDRYIVATAVDQPNSAGAYTSSAVTTRAKQLSEQLLIDKKAAAEKLNMSYDPSTEPAPTISTPSGRNLSGTTQRVNPQSPAGQQAIAEYAASHPDPGISELKADAKGYRPIAFYTTTESTVDGTLTTMQDDKESFTDDDQSSANRQKDILQSNGLAVMDTAIIKPFLLSNNGVKSSAIPIVITYTQAAHLLGMALPSNDASTTRQSAYVKTLYTKAPTIMISACYRNSVSEQEIQTAISQAQEIAQNKNKTDYKKPDLLYGLPAANTCGQAPILSDTRTEIEKTQQKKQNEFDKMFGQEVDPVQARLTFQVVGLKPDPALSGDSTTTGDILESVVGSSLDSTITIPSTLLNAMPNASSIKSILFSPTANPFGGFSPTTYLVEFADATDARNFINQKTCTTGPAGKCGTASKPFQLFAYGSNSIGIQDLKNKFVNFFELAMLIIAVIALVIMGATVGRMIADGRRETAVFRSIGAKRGDIVIIYAIYTLCLSLYVALFALIAGIGLAYLFDRHFWQNTTIQAQLLFGASDTSREFHFFNFTPLVWLVALVAIICGLLSMSLPIIRNVRRSPISDMREE